MSFWLSILRNGRTDAIQGVVVVDQATALPVVPLTDAQLRNAAVPVIGPLTEAQLRAVPVVVEVGTKAISVPALGAGGTGLIGWLSQIWSALTGTLTVTAGQITSVTATIASGASISGDIDLGTARLGRIAMPAAWTAADITLQTSFDNVLWNSLYDKDGAEYTIKAAQGRSMLIPLSDMLSVRYLRIRSGTSAAPVAQAAARTLVLVLVP